MIEVGRCPSCTAGMAEKAVGREACFQMVRFSGQPVFTNMAFLTRCWCTKSSCAVTLEAFKRLVNTLEAESRFDRVVPFIRRYPFPVLGAVTVSALKAQGELVAIVLPTRPVAGLAVGRGTFQNTIEMAFTTLDGAMPAGKGKVGLVVLLNSISMSLLLKPS